MTNTKDPPATAGHAGPPPTHDPPPKDEHERLAMTGMQSKAPAPKPDPDAPDPTQSYLLGEKVPKPDPHAKAGVPGAKTDPATIMTGTEPGPTPWNSPGQVAPDQVGKPQMKAVLPDPSKPDLVKHHPDPHQEHKDDPAQGRMGGEAEVETQGAAPHQQGEAAAHAKKGR